MAVRTSPVHEQLMALQPQWEDRSGMRVAMWCAPDDAAKLDAVAIADLSYLRRCGLKGPGAHEWLQRNGIEASPDPNTWMPLPGGGLMARLGRSEFFLEDGPHGSEVVRLRQGLGTGAPGVVPVVRQDAAFAIAGARVNDLLVQTCNVNFLAFGPEEKVAVMTQMIGVSVLAIRTAHQPLPCYRLWCDPTFAPYFWETFSGIAAELGGGIIGAGTVPG